MHTLSVSLNKIGDINYYDGGLPLARSYYSRSLDVRREALKDNPENTSQVKEIHLCPVCVNNMFFTVNNLLSGSGTISADYFLAYLGH